MNNESYDIGALVGKNSGGDFTIAYASATTLTLGTYPDGSSVTADDIVSIEQFTSAGVPITKYARDERAMAVAANVLTVTGAAFTNGDIYIIYTNVPRQGTTAPTVVSSGADGVSNTQNATTTSARLSGFNGTTWDRLRAGITAVTGTLTGMLNTLPWAVYNATPTVRTEGQGGPLQTNENGDVRTTLGTLLGGEDQTNNVIAVVDKPIAGNTYTGTKTQNNAFTTLNLKATPGNVLGFRVINTTASARYFQLHNTATTPAGGATAQEKFLIPAGGQLVVGRADLPVGGLFFSVGIAYAVSTVASTYTAGTSGDLLLDINHV